MTRSSVISVHACSCGHSAMWHQQFLDVQGSRARALAPLSPEYGRVQCPAAEPAVPIVQGTRRENAMLAIQRGCRQRQAHPTDRRAARTTSESRASGSTPEEGVPRHGGRCAGKAFAASAGCTRPSLRGRTQGRGQSSLRAFLLLASLIVLFANPPDVAAQDAGDAWTKLIRTAEAILGDDGVIASDDKIDALVELHATFCREVLGRPVSSQQTTAMKIGLRAFLNTAAQRYTGDTRHAVLRLMRDLSANRAVFVELLTSTDPPGLIEQRLLAYLERNQKLGYSEPVPIAAQAAAPASDKDLAIVADKIRMVSDVGSAGHANRAIDAGETITLNIPLRNQSTKSYRSTSAFLRTQDRFVRADVSEAIYTGQSTVDGKTVVFAPGTTITSRQNFTFTILPDCPDDHRIDFEVLIWDSDHGKFTLPLQITPYRVGPLEFGAIRIDDDVPGYSDGNGDGAIDSGETIEYVLALQNQGAVDILNVQATLFSPIPHITFEKGFNELKYGTIEAHGQQPVSASFVFTAAPKTPDGRPIPEELYFRLFITGTARGHAYSWVQARYHVLGLRDEQLAQARQDPSVFALEIRRPTPFYRRVEIENQRAVVKEKRGTLSADNDGAVGRQVLPEIKRDFVDKRGNKVEFTMREVERAGEWHREGEPKRPTGRSRGCAVYLEITVRAGGQVLKKEVHSEQVSTWIKVEYVGNNGYEAEHYTALVPQVQAEYHDAGPLRFVIARGSDKTTLYVFVYRVDLGDRLVPTAVSDPEERYRNTPSGKQYTFEYKGN